MNRDILAYRRRLDHLFQKKVLPQDDFELQAEWAKYLCVLTSGFIEVSLRALCIEYAKKRSDVRVLSFVESHIKEFQNPKTEKILSIIKTFDSAWEAEVRQLVNGEKKDSIDSIVANRHQIAHGKSIGLSLGTMQKYYQNAVIFIEDLEAYFA